MSGRHYAPSLAGAPASTNLVKHRLDEIDENNEEYNASTFGGFSDYNRRKKLKLQNQDALLRARAPADNPTIFAGMTIHINGYTKPGRVDLWNMIVSYGGVYKQYLEGKTDVTHIIASNLTKKKQQEFSKYRIVRPEWIVDSISAGKVLPWHDRRYRVLEVGKDQHTIKVSETDGFLLGSDSVQKSYKDTISESVNHNVVKDSLFTTAKYKIAADALPHKQDLSRTEDVLKNEGDFPVSEKPTDNFVQNDRSDAESHGLLVQRPQLLDTTRKLENRSATKTAKDPDFIQDYFRNSRLHHLSTWKANLRLKIDNLSKAMSTQTAVMPQKFVMHVDFDCFFAAISAKDRPEVHGKPCAVTHGGSNSGEIASCNYKAREFGVKNGMWMKEAVKLCPDIISLPYDFDAYEAASDLFYNILLDLRATVVEAVSIDEALVNISNLMPNSDNLLELESHAMLLAGLVRDKVRSSTGVEVSIGIGANVLQAKLAIKRAKPAGQFFLGSDKLIETLDTFSVASLPGVGYSTTKKLEEHFSITTVQELRDVSQMQLQEVFGPKTGISLAQASRGIDETIVGNIAQRKLVSIEINWGIRLDTPEEVSDYMRRVSIELCRKLTDVGFRSAQHLLVKVMRRSKTAPIDPPKFLGHGPCDKFNAGREISMTGDATLVWKHSLALLESLHIPPNELRGIGVALTKLQTVASSLDPVQMPMSKYFNAAPADLPVVIQEKEMQGKESMAPPRRRETANTEVLAIEPTQYIIPSQVDPTVLLELPKAIQDKIQQVGQKSAGIVNPQLIDVYDIPRASQIDPADLAALPASLRHEILLHSRHIKSPKRNTINKFVIKTPSPKKKKNGGSLMTLTQANFVERPTRQNLTSNFRNVAEAIGISSSPSADIDRAVLAVLPEDIRREVILEDRHRRLAQIRKDRRDIAKDNDASHDSSHGERARKMIDLPQGEKLNYGDLGVESLEGLKDYLKIWYEDEKEKGPDDRDMDDFRGYLGLLITQERDLERVESLLRWIWSLVVRDCDSLVWVQAARDLIDWSNASMAREGLGELKLEY